MNDEKCKKLEAAGWKVGAAEEFLAPDEKSFIVVQAPTNNAWRAYLNGWVKNGVHVPQNEDLDPRALPVWINVRAEALKLDEQTARQLVEYFDKRYDQAEGRRIVQHTIEELP